MNKYRIRMHTRLDGGVFYWVEKRCLFFFWDRKECFLSLEAAKRGVENAKNAGWVTL